MACVVNMVRKYSGCTVRTLLRVPNAASNANAAAAAEALKSEAQRTLTEARIDAVIEPVLLDAEELTPESYELKVRDKTHGIGKLRNHSKQTLNLWILIISTILD